MADFMEQAKKMGAYAADKAMDSAKIGKYKAGIAKQKSEITDIKRKIGEYCYGKYVSGDKLDPAIEEYCAAIEECNDKVNELEIKIGKVKADED